MWCIGPWSHLFWQVGADVSGHHAASKFRIELCKIKTVHFSESVVPTSGDALLYSKSHCNCWSASLCWLRTRLWAYHWTLSISKICFVDSLWSSSGQDGSLLCPLTNLNSLATCIMSSVSTSLLQRIVRQFSYVLLCLLTYCIENSPWEANSFSVSQDIPCIL